MSYTRQTWLHPYTDPQRLLERAVQVSSAQRLARQTSRQARSMPLFVLNFSLVRCPPGVDLSSFNNFNLTLGCGGFGELPFSASQFSDARGQAPVADLPAAHPTWEKTYNWETGC